MFKNVSNKIKGLAKVFNVIAILGLIIAGIYFVWATLEASDYELFSSLIIALGSFVLLVSTWFIYGFGQLIENTDIIAGRNSLDDNTPETTAKDTINTTAQNTINTTDNRVRCPHCKQSVIMPNNTNIATCPYCQREIRLY